MDAYDKWLENIKKTTPSSSDGDYEDDYDRWLKQIKREQEPSLLSKGLSLVKEEGPKLAKKLGVKTIQTAKDLTAPLTSQDPVEEIYNRAKPIVEMTTPVGAVQKYNEALGGLVPESIKKPVSDFTANPLVNFRKLGREIIQEGSPEANIQPKSYEQQVRDEATQRAGIEPILKPTSTVGKIGLGLAKSAADTGTALSTPKMLGELILAGVFPPYAYTFLPGMIGGARDSMIKAYEAYKTGDMEGAAYHAGNTLANAGMAAGFGKRGLGELKTKSELPPEGPPESPPGPQGPPAGPAATQIAQSRLLEQKWQDRQKPEAPMPTEQPLPSQADIMNRRLAERGIPSVPQKSRIIQPNAPIPQDVEIVREGNSYIIRNKAENYKWEDTRADSPQAAIENYHRETAKEQVQPQEPLQATPTNQPSVKQPLEATKGMGVGASPIKVYHGTTKAFKEAKANVDYDTGIIDRWIGVHYSESPDIANKFAIKEGGRVLFDTIDPNTVYDLPQRKYENGVLESDQWSFQRDIGAKVFPARPDLLKEYLKQQGYKPNMIDDILSSPEKIKNFTSEYGLLPLGDLGKEIVTEYNRIMKELGYDSIRYQNTAPMETEGIKNKTSYVKLGGVKNAVIQGVEQEGVQQKRLGVSQGRNVPENLEEVRQEEGGRSGFSGGVRAAEKVEEKGSVSEGKVGYEPMRPVESTGETKKQRLGARLAGEEKAPTYEATTTTAHGDLVKKDIKRAERIAMGEEEPPKGVLANAVLVDLENHATKTGNAELINKLRDTKLSGASTRMGQEISALQEFDPHSPISIINEIERSAESAIKKKGQTIETEKNKIKKEIESETQKLKPKQLDFNDLLESIRCK